MTDIVSRYATKGCAVETSIPRLFVSHRSDTTNIDYHDERPRLVVVAQGAKSVRFGDRELRYGPGDSLLVSLDTPVASKTIAASVEKPFLAAGLAIHPASLADVVRRAPAFTSLPASREERQSVTVKKTPPELLDAMVRLLRLLDRPRDAPALAPLLEQEILYRVLTGPGGSRLFRIARSQAPAGRIAKTVGWLRANYAERFRIEDLAAHVGMSASSLHHHFRTVTAMTPLQYQKRLRLHEARRLIVAEDVDVGEAAFRVGYQSPSQFSREYRRYYGTSAAQDRLETRTAPTRNLRIRK